MSPDVSQSFLSVCERVAGEKHGLAVKTKETLQYLSPFLASHTRQLRPWHPDSVPGFIRPWAMPESGYSWRQPSPRCTQRARFVWAERDEEMYGLRCHTETPSPSSPIKSLLSTQSSAGMGEENLLISISFGTNRAQKMYNTYSRPGLKRSYK